MRLNVLGPLELAGGTATVPLRSPKLRRLLAGLLVSAGTVVSVDRLADAVWGDAPPGDVDASMHNLISRLRATLRVLPASAGDEVDGAVEVLTRAPGYVLLLDRAALDATRFEDLLAEGRALLADESPRAGGVLERAVALWRGDAYAEFAFEDFARAEAARLDELRLVAIEERAEAALQGGQHDEVINWVQPLATAQPVRERPRSQLMVALYREGRHADALAVYDDYRNWLDDELGLEPSSDLQRLQTAVLRRDPSLDAAVERARTPAGAVRRVEAPSPPADPPVGAESAGVAPHAPDGAAAPAGNLPAELSALIGRENALAQVADALRAARVVTLTGPGGVGKTSLALSAAAQAVRGPADGTTTAQSFPDGAWLVELAAVHDGATVAEAVTTALSVQQRHGLSATERLVEYLRPKALLLVLDNCEHVIESAATLVDAIIRGCSAVRVLATSREPLELAGEQVRAVPPLPVPSLAADDAGRVAAAPSVALFVERAQAGSGFRLTDDNAATVAELCRRLDGLPLAIELAATRVRSMGVDDVVERLGSRFRLLRGGRRVTAERHRTLGAVVDWSYRLLTAEEQRAFDRLSVFSADFGLAAAEGVAGRESPECIDQTDAADVDDLLAGLVDKSMVSVQPISGVTRYALLETLRAYGRQRLHERGETSAAHLAHALHHVELVERAAEGMNGPDHVAASEAITREFAELRAAHAWSLGNDLDLAVRLVAALVDYAEHRMPPEAFIWAEHTISATLAADFASTQLPAVYAVAASGARFRGDLARAVALAEDGLTVSASSDDPARRLPLYLLSEVALFEGRLQDSDRISKEVEHLAECAGDVMRQTWAATNDALVRSYSGDHAAAIERADEVVRWADRTRHPMATAWSRYVAGEVRMERDPDRAGELLDDALTRARSTGEVFLAGVALVSLASLRARHGDPRRAAVLFRDVIEHWHAAGNWTQQWTTMRNVVDLLVRLHLDEGAAVLLGALEASDTSAPVFGADAGRLVVVRRLLTDRMKAEKHAAATARGAALTDDEVIGFACRMLDQAAHAGTSVS